MYEDGYEFGKEQQLYGAAETERLAAALEHAPNVQKVAGLMRRYDTQISRKFHSLLDQLRRYRADKRRYPDELEPRSNNEDIDPDYSGGGGNVTAVIPQDSERETENSDELHSSRAARPAVSPGAATSWTAGSCTSLIAVGWSAGTCTSLQNGFAARHSRSQRASASEGIASASPSRGEVRNEPENASPASPDTPEPNALERDAPGTNSHVATAAAGTGGEFACVTRIQ